MESRNWKEAFRKAIHISSLVIPLSYLYILHENRMWMFLVLLPLTLVAMTIEILRLENRTYRRIFYHLFGIILRKHEMNNFTGATYLLVSSLVCFAFFPGDKIAFFAISSLAIGDTFAAIVGILLGKRKIKGTNKSLEGSLACFISTFTYGLLFRIHPVLCFVGALATTVAEASRIPMDDNIKIPVFTAIVMAVANIFIPG